MHDWLQFVFVCVKIMIACCLRGRGSHTAEGIQTDTHCHGKVNLGTAQKAYINLEWKRGNIAELRVRRLLIDGISNDRNGAFFISVSCLCLA